MEDDRLLKLLFYKVINIRNKQKGLVNMLLKTNVKILALRFRNITRKLICVEENCK